MADTNEKDKKIIKDFIWDNPNGLRFVSDDMLKACNLLYEKASLELDFVDKSGTVITSDNKQSRKRLIKISLSNNISGLCDYRYTVQDLLSALEREDNKLPDGRDLFKEEKAEFTHSVINSNSYYPDYQIEDICAGCKFEKCPKFKYYSLLLYKTDKK